MVTKKVLISGLAIASLALTGCSAIQTAINNKIASTAKEVSGNINNEVAKTTDALKAQGEKMQSDFGAAADQLKKEFGAMKTYSNDEFSVDYPANFKAEEETFGKAKVITISSEKGKIQIGDFEPDASPGPQPGMTQKQIDTFPKDTTIHGYDGKTVSALFYTTGDEKTAKTLKEIQATIRLK